MSLDNLLSNAWLTTPLGEYARVFKAQHRVEECLQRAKGEAGLGDYEVRTWRGWHHHQTLALVATWLRTQEARRGKKIHAGVDRAAGAGADRGGGGAAVGDGEGGVPEAYREPAATPHGGSPLVSLESTQPLAPAQGRSTRITAPVEVITERRMSQPSSPFVQILRTARQIREHQHPSAGLR